jgi:hypothetical protein
VRVPVKVGLVVAGYVGAFGVASAVVAAHVVVTNGPDRQGASGMYAFGDSLFFLAAFGVSAIPATGAALFFLRPCRRFWLGLSVAALVVTATGLAALVCYLAGRSASPGSALQYWGAFAVLRILMAPLCALGFFLSALLAPSRSSRIALAVAALAETVVVIYMALIWLQPFRHG